jgi:hypothetical protein
MLRLENREANMHSTPESYKVGYRNPPKERQFQKGRSGNLNGRPKRNTNLLDGFRALLQEDIQTADGKEISKQEALVRALVRDAASGNSSAFSRFVKLAKRAGLLKDLSPPPKPMGGVVHFPWDTFAPCNDRP